MKALALRVVIAAGLVIGGASHAYLYLHGYGQVPTIGPAFLIQASVSFAAALLILAGGPDWLIWGAGALALGSLGAFAMSRTIGLAGFIERGWQPAPHALVSVVAEAVTALACGAWVLGAARARGRSARRRQSERTEDRRVAEDGDACDRPRPVLG